MSEQKCKVCGCTEMAACVTPAGPCSWVERDLCSGCAGKFYRTQGIEFSPDSMVALERPVQLELTAGHAFMLIAALQLACRHPRNTGPTRQFVEVFARQVQQQIATTPQLAFILAAGWDPENDMPPAEETGRIVLP